MNTMDKILETIELDFKGQSTNRNLKTCVYLNTSKRKCAIGLFMNPGKHQNYVGGVRSLINVYGKSCIHTLPTNSLKKLTEFQHVHDGYNFDNTNILKSGEHFKDLSTDEQKMLLQFSALYLFEDEV